MLPAGYRILNSCRTYFSNPVITQPWRTRVSYIGFGTCGIASVFLYKQNERLKQELKEQNELKKRLSNVLIIGADEESHKNEKLFTQKAKAAIIAALVSCA